MKSAKFTKLEKSWISFDWANSVYATIMMAAIFPVYFTAIVNDINGKGDMWWAVGTFIATFTMAILAPILGAIADYKGMKKKLLIFFLLLGLGFTLFNAITDNWKFMLVGYIFSFIGFLGSSLIYDSFITDITTKDRMDKVSAWGYAMGYFGGSTIPFLAAIALIMTLDSKTVAVKISLVIAVTWWAIFSIPMLLNVKQKYYTEKSPGNLIINTFKNIKKTMIDIFKEKRILYFLLAYFFYIDGVNTVISMATAYGASLGLDTTGMILALLVTQLVAVPFAILFGRLANKFGSLNLILTAIFMYAFICILGFIMGLGIEESFLSIDQALILFWILAILVGTSQGGIQALSRSYFGKLIPPSRSTEYFGFYDIFGKFAAILGPGLYGLVRVTTGRSSLSILAIIFLFIIGGIFILINKKNDKITD
ncbi:MAG: MFS transporter [Firmicutes bacterium]|nr:MFS transporter [Bacillota bacterium]